MAPLTGIALANKWLISKLNLNFLLVKTTRMTTFGKDRHQWLGSTLRSFRAYSD